MFHDNKPARVAGPFGYSPRNLAALTPEERDAMRRELDALDTKLQWGYEPGRWAKGAAWHDDDWPEPNLLGRGELTGAYDRRDGLIAEAGDFRATLDGADKAWKRQAGLNSPFLPVLAARPKRQREQMRERSKAIRDLVAFGETPERWAQGIGYMRDDLRDPDADTERLVALHGQRNDLLPALDAMDHALDYLDEVDAEGGADAPGAPIDGNPFGGYAFQVEPAPDTASQFGLPAYTLGGQPAENALQTYALQADEKAQPGLPTVSKPKPAPLSSPSDPDKPDEEKPDDGDGDKKPDDGDGDKKPDDKDGKKKPDEDKPNERCKPLQALLNSLMKEEREHSNKLALLDNKINALMEQRRILSNEVLEHLSMGAASGAASGMPDKGAPAGPGWKKIGKKIIKKFGGPIGTVAEAAQAYDKEAQIEELERKIFSAKQDKESAKYALAATREQISKEREEFRGLGCEWNPAWGYPG